MSCFTLQTALFGRPKTYAAWPVWKGSVRAEVKFSPLPKKQANSIYCKARDFNRSTKIDGRYGGVLGSAALRVLEVLVFDILNYKSGQLDPSYEKIAAKAGLSRSTVAVALKRLKELRIIHWLKRCVEEWIDGRFTLKQSSNAYAVCPPSQWMGYVDPDPDSPAPPPERWAWGAAPVMLTGLEEACALDRESASPAAVIRALESDPSDEKALILGRMMRRRMANS